MDENGSGLFDNRLWKWKGTVWVTCGQPLMEIEEDCLGNRLWKWKGTV
jgi:hypothetical protein